MVPAISIFLEVSLLILFQSSSLAFHAATISTTPSVAAISRIQSRLYSTQNQGYRVDVSKEGQRDPNGVLEWAQYYGVSLENYQVRPQPSTSRNNQNDDNWGVYTTQAGRAGERVLFVPAMLRITSQSVREQDFAQQAPQIAQAIDSTYNDGDTDIPLACHFYLFLKVLQEYDQGSDSAYVSWMDALPRTFTTALTFTEYEMDCLPPFVKFLALKDRGNYDMFLQVLQSLNTPTISSETKANEEITQWAFNVVFTRARAAFGEAEIIPVADMMNHDSHANVEVQYDEEGNVHVILLRDVSVDEQLYKCYGQPTNPSRFLATYGFFDTSPPSTYCKLAPGVEISQELMNMGLGYDKLVFHVEDGGIAPEVWDAVLFINLLHEGNQELQQQFYNSHMQGDADTKNQIHQFCKEQTCSSLLQHVEDTIDELDTCAYIMDSGGLGLSHKNIPMIRKHNEFVLETFGKVKKSLKQIQRGLY